VVTPPDRPRGRGQRVSAPPAAAAARELGIDLFQSANVNDDESRNAITRAAPAAIAVCEFGQLIKPPLLDEHLMLNVHPSLLPRWRGAAPIERALMAGDAETGVTIFKVTAGLDSGPIALQRSEPVEPEDTAGTLAGRLARLGGELLVQTLDRAEAGALELTEQGEDGATYAPKIDGAERRLDPARRAIDLERTVRALTPHVGVYLALEGGERLGVTRARAVDESLAPGELQASKGSILVGCADGALELLEVRPSGKRTMGVAEFLRGHGLPRRAESKW
jgi:methionyl-tRNA formyltransferase